MNFELSDEEHLVEESTKQFCRAEFDRTTIRRLVDEGDWSPDGTWKAQADQGWFSLRLPEEQGGAGLGMVAASLVFGVIGRALVPGPVLWSHLAATALPQPWGPLVAEGRLVATGAVQRTAQRMLVPDLERADLVLFVGDDAVRVAGAAEVEARRRASLDPSRTIYEVTAAETEIVGDAAVAQRIRLEGACLAAAEAAGGAGGVTDHAVEYASARSQFGQPIGAFQAVKHLCADMAVRALAAESAARWAALHVDAHGVAAGAELVRMAKVVAGRAFLANARAAIQVFGAIGYTWEHDAHLYLKRAHSLDRAFGDASVLAGEIGRRLVDSDR